METMIKIKIQGPVGSGKSTLLQLINKHLSDLGFKIRYDDVQEHELFVINFMDTYEENNTP